MLQIENISKKYVTGDLTQTALDNVSLNLRDNEFVAILGPSGSGKTTLLNIIGGLDRYDSGDLIINGISTKKYKDRDWDSYRNHTIGFVFQSYNLIPHQTVLSNVELALTISGISKSERKRRAKEALEQVGLGNQLHKRPNQMSGGQMQRVAIARALVNDPDILLADEPTGALDTETSIQVMELLKEVAKNRLVVMVTHNPELAEEYATRIVKVRDGVILDDSDPYEPDQSQIAPPEHKNMGRSSMSHFTALALSFNNLRTKKGRTFLTAFAGSIGIIGIALILSLSHGVNSYITDIQKDTMLSYPIKIEDKTIDLSSLMDTDMSDSKEAASDHDKDAVYSNGKQLEMESTMTTSITENNLTSFKKYLDDKNSEIHQYIGDNGIVYSYATKFDVFTYDSEDTLVKTDGSTLEDTKNSLSSGNSSYMGSMSSSSGNGGMSMMMSTSNVSENYEEMMPGNGDEMISEAVGQNYDMVYGNWPAAYNEVVLVLDKNNEIDLTTLYQLGILPTSEYRDMMKQMEGGDKLELDAKKLSYEDICNQSFYMIPSSDYYIENANGTFTSVADNKDEVKKLLENAVQLKITGVIRQKEDSDISLMSRPVGYTQALTDYLIKHTEESAVVKAQRANPEINILNAMKFAPADDAAKIADAKTYLANLGVSEKAAMAKTLFEASAAASGSPMMINSDETQLAAMMDSYLANPDDESLLAIYNGYVSAGDYDKNMEAFGVVSLDAPSSISIYADSFEGKDGISKSIENYNKTVDEKDKITYTDYVGLLMSSVTTIINVISYVLIAFVAVSLIVSSIMIGIITYISVLERTKEIGILRAMGASKRNISQVFNAETFIIGLFAGLIGIGITLVLLFPINSIIHVVADSTAVNASLPVSGAVILILLSMFLTLLGGLIPAKKAAKKDPVTALRTE